MSILPLREMNMRKINDKALTKAVCDGNYYEYV